MRLDPDDKLAALGYRNAVVTIWDLAAMESIGNFEKEGCEDVHSSVQVIDMIFNPIPELELLAITYKDGDIVTCNPWTLETENLFEAQAILDCLAATSDGRILAGAAEGGGIYLFLFETLQPIYQIARSDNQLLINDLAFSTDNLRFFDIRGHSCNVWEPHVLIPRGGGDDSSSEPYREEVFIPETPASHAPVFQWGEAITVIETTSNGKALFFGRQDGTIDMCEVSTGETVEKLRLHDPFAEIHHLEWNDAKPYMLSLEIAGRHMINRFSAFGKNRSKAQVPTLLDRRERSDIVRQALLSPGGTSVLLCTDSSAKLIGLGGTVVAEEASLAGKSWWIRHPLNPAHLIAIQGGTVHLFSCSFLELLTMSGGVAFQPSLPEPPRIRTATGASP